MPRANATKTHASIKTQSPDNIQTAQANLRSQAGAPSGEHRQRKIPEDRKATGMASKLWSRCAGR